MADEMRIAAEDLSWFLKPSTIPKHYFMYMFLPVVNEAQLVASNKTYTDEYKQLQVKVHQLMPSTLPMDACYAAVFFLFLFALLRVGISFFLPTYFNSLGKSTFPFTFIFTFKFTFTFFLKHLLVDTPNRQKQEK